MTTDMHFIGELTIATQVADLDHAIAWYAEMLGCEVIYKLDEMGWAEVSSPVANVTIGLSQVDPAPARCGGSLISKRPGRGSNPRMSGLMATRSRSPTQSAWQPSLTPMAMRGCSRRA